MGENFRRRYATIDGGQEVASMAKGTTGNSFINVPNVYTVMPVSDIRLPLPAAATKTPVRVEDIEDCLKVRCSRKGIRSEKTVKRLRKELKYAEQGVARSIKLAEKLGSGSYRARLQAILQELPKHGVTNLSVCSAHGGWFKMYAELKGREVACHVWADLRGPVLDVSPGDGPYDTRKPLLRIKYFTKIFVTNNLLDFVLTPKHKPTNVYDEVPF